MLRPGQRRLERVDAGLEQRRHREEEQRVAAQAAREGLVEAPLAEELLQHEEERRELRPAPHGLERVARRREAAVVRRLEADVDSEQARVAAPDRAAPRRRGWSRRRRRRGGGGRAARGLCGGGGGGRSGASVSASARAASSERARGRVRRNSGSGHPRTAGSASSLITGIDAVSMALILADPRLRAERRGERLHAPDDAGVRPGRGRRRAPRRRARARGGPAAAAPARTRARRRRRRRRRPRPRRGGWARAPVVGRRRGRRRGRRALRRRPGPGVAGGVAGRAAARLRPARAAASAAAGAPGAPAGGLGVGSQLRPRTTTSTSELGRSRPVRHEP